MKNGNAKAFNIIAKYYANGSNGMPQNRAKANELWLKAGELGCANAYSRLVICMALDRAWKRIKRKLSTTMKLQL